MHAGWERRRGTGKAARRASWAAGTMQRRRSSAATGPTPPTRSWLAPSRRPWSAASRRTLPHKQAVCTDGSALRAHSGSALRAMSQPCVPCHATVRILAVCYYSHEVPLPNLYPLSLMASPMRVI